MDSVAKVVAEQLCVLRGYPVSNAGCVDLGENLFDHFGVTSLDMVLLMTIVCEQTHVPLTKLSESDIAKLQTPSEIVELLKQKGAGEVTCLGAV